MSVVYSLQASASVSNEERSIFQRKRERKKRKIQKDNFINSLTLALLGPEEAKELILLVGHRALVMKNLGEWKKAIHSYEQANKVENKDDEEAEEKPLWLQNSSDL
ncbi:hypothetical protein EVAR_75887_1 [Eumeta japonica]|uniref:Uncharacterized protein n=1 Tax=Eumeta variegata TaxID=151549 RepID=A0A4C1UXD4_EUMVA|nr:hypothetical protein EVAR_75887_1 [Eumeta japonica]